MKKVKRKAAAQRRPAQSERKNRVFSAKRQAVWFEMQSISMEPHEASAKERGEGVLFQRIRRITGYLVGTLDRFNNAKRAEERERVKHGMGGRGAGR